MLIPHNTGIVAAERQTSKYYAETYKQASNTDIMRKNKTETETVFCAVT